MQTNEQTYYAMRWSQPYQTRDWDCIGLTDRNKVY